MKRFGPLIDHAATGFKLPESLARRIDDLSRNLPREFAYQRIAHKADAFTLDPGERTDVSVITTDALDRDGEVVLPAGGDWSGYNRVVTFAHRYDQLPVGASWWIRAKGNTLVAKTHYPDRPADWGGAPWLPSAILHLMQQPIPTCTGKSIGFVPLNIRQATAEETSRRPEIKHAKIIDRWIGVEYAVVPVPSNPEAQMQAVAKGIESGILDEKFLDLLQEAAGEWPLSSLIAETLQRKRPLAIDLREQIAESIRNAFARATGRV